MAPKCGAQTACFLDRIGGVEHLLIELGVGRRSVAADCRRRSWREALDRPPVLDASVAQPIMHPVGAALPELDHVRADPVAAPERWRGNVGAGESFLDLSDLLVELGPRCHHLGLR